MIGRRAVLASGAAAVLGNAAQVLQFGGPTLDFDSLGGSTRNSGERNRIAFVAAVARLASAGGGTLRIAARTYPFSGEAGISASNVSIAARGATFAGERCRITTRRGPEASPSTV